MPLYLNALPGRGVHLVTVNNYLARRDSQALWLGWLARRLGVPEPVVEVPPFAEHLALAERLRRER